jgi:hypothetical protein
MLTTTSAVHSGPVRITAALGAAALSAAPAVRTPPAAARDARTNSTTAAGPARPNKIGQFGMVSLAALEQIAQHVEPIQGLHVWTAQALYVALAGCASQQGTASTAEGQRCRVTVAELASRTRMGKRNVQRYLTALVEAGVLKILHRHDALHRPVASDYVFSYPGQDSPGKATPESASPAPRVAPAPRAAPESGPTYDSGVTTVTQKEESKNPDQERRQTDSGGDERAPHPAAIAADPDEHATGSVPYTPKAGEEPQTTGAPRRWNEALDRLSRLVTPAGFVSWLAPLEVLQCDDSSGAGSDRPAIRLRCQSAFHRDQVHRRYRPLIEQALGGTVELVVEPRSVPAPGAPYRAPGSETS